MLFNSHEFIFLFLPSSLAAFYLLRNAPGHYRAYVIILSSLIFYGYWSVLYTALLIASITWNYYLGILIGGSTSKPKRKAMLIVGIVCNILLLFYYKYYNFFIENLNFIFPIQASLISLALPLAISFYTLQQVAYLVDVYQGVSVEKRYSRYFMFVSFFPQLIAGPIVRHRDMQDQYAFDAPSKFDTASLFHGIIIFSLGLAKKVLIADNFGVWADAGFSNPSTLSSYEALLVSWCYTLQIYFDFSGYSDMAVGLGLMFGVSLPFNFNSPLQARGMIDFWKRWHITLTNFITSYIYTPMLRSMNKITFARAMIVTIVSFAVAGFWHGAAWTFIIFGALNGLGIACNHVWKKKVRKNLSFGLHPFLCWFVTVNYVNVCLTFFRADSVTAAAQIVSKAYDPISLSTGLFSIQTPGLYFLPRYAILPIIVAIGLCVLCKNTREIAPAVSSKPLVSGGLALIAAAAVFEINTYSSFLYFNF